MTAANPRAVIGNNNPPSLTEVLKDKHAPIFDRLKKWEAKAKKADLAPQTLEACAALDKLFLDGKDIANDADSIREQEKEPYLRAGKEIDTVFNAGVRDVVGVKGGLAQKIADASAAKKLAVARAAQQAEREKAEALQREADKLAAKAKADEDAGRVKQADQKLAQAEAVAAAAGAADAASQADLRTASRSVIGGIKSSVSAAMVCTGIIRKELDLEELRPFLKEADLIAAVNARLRNDTSPIKGAVLTEKAIGSVRR